MVTTTQKCVFFYNISDLQELKLIITMNKTIQISIKECTGTWKWKWLLVIITHQWLPPPPPGTPYTQTTQIMSNTNYNE